MRVPSSATKRDPTLENRPDESSGFGFRISASVGGKLAETLNPSFPGWLEAMAGVLGAEGLGFRALGFGVRGLRFRA